MVVYRPAVALLILLTLTGCLGVEALASPAPDIAVENRATGAYVVTATVIHTAEPVGAVDLELTFRDGSTETLSYSEHAAGNDFDVPSNVTDLRVVGAPATSWQKELAPGETASTTLTDWESNDIVLLTWSRLDTGRVTRVTTIPCRSSGMEYHAHVSSARGSGGASTVC